jgi:potassium voltage-gated channel Eag-related subfamily H protein 5
MFLIRTLLYIFVSHICSCTWHYIGILQIRDYPSDKVWLVRHDLLNASTSTKYIYSFYFSTITTATVGYGDITPVCSIHCIFKETEIEMTCVSIMVIITSIVFGYTISSIGSIFAQIKEKNDTYKNNMAQINSYLKKKITNINLQM